MFKKKKKLNIWQKLYKKLEILRKKNNGLDFSEVIPVAELGLDESLVSKGSPDIWGNGVFVYSNILVSKILAHS
jgi:hypothetical protein